ncbi:MAG: hypothetical protein O3B76_12040 [Proteobacteria bacterium]|nr:hypothetical protein [Pseudomonadota bacterium]MDA1023795.1 hypothetical protein [Pseudomonadota bacterium]
MQLLKGTVIGLGVLIMLAGGLLAYGLYQKSQDPGWRLFSSVPAPAPGPSASKPFGAVNLNLPEGCVIARVLPDGERAYLTIGPSGACNRIVVVDITTGRVLGTIQPGK